MKNLALLALSALLVCSCSGRGAVGSAREVESEAIYKQVVARAEQYNGCSIRAAKELIARPIDSNDLRLIRDGLTTRFTIETQKTIDNYNLPGADDSMAALKRGVKTSGDSLKYRLSKIGFNELLNYAVLYEQDNVNPDLAHSTFIFLKKDVNEWAIDSEVMK